VQLHWEEENCPLVPESVTSMIGSQTTPTESRRTRKKEQKTDKNQEADKMKKEGKAARK
jgi:hypothetical protein